MTLDLLYTGHDKFKQHFDKHRRSWSKLIDEGQQPQVLWIGCSDSRVIPEQITSAKPGDLFVMRNIANVVPPYGTSGDASSAVLEFAVQELGVEHVIICGHTFCGGVQKIMDRDNLNTSTHTARWAAWILPALSQVETSNIPENDRYLETIKANILLQRRNVENYPVVRDAVKSGQLRVHAWLFDLESGVITTFDTASSTWIKIGSHLHE
ncbi:MAG: carbonic anhydrase [Candidatus Promineifilaceae bacterium]|jgi:carbonic anhydrase